MTFFWHQFRFCPRCGTEYRPSDFDPQAIVFVCRQCAYEFFQNSSPAATAVIPSKLAPRRIILLMRATNPGAGLLALPGGFLRYDESPYVAVRREVQEEIALSVDVRRVLHSYIVDYRYRESRVSVIEIVFLTEPIDEDVDSIRTGEASAVGYYDVEEILNDAPRLAFPEQRQALEQYQRGLMG